jgi:cytochrome c-type biogenesis protein
MADLSTLAFAAAFGAGVVSFLSPCVLPLVPGYVSYVAGDTLAHAAQDQRTARRWASFGLSLCFVAGFSTVFIALGAGAALVSQVLLRYKNEAAIAGGVLVIAFGLFTVGLLKLPFLARDLRVHAAPKGSRPLVAYLMGLAFAFGWTPCIGPILGAILTVTAVAESLPGGVALLAVYSLGLGVPFLLTGVFTETLLKRMKLARRAGHRLQVTAGIAMVVVGAAMVTGLLTDFAIWLLQAFPALGTLG